MMIGDYWILALPYLFSLSYWITLHNTLLVFHLSTRNPPKKNSVNTKNFLNNIFNHICKFIVNVDAKLCKRIFLAYWLMQIALNTVFLIHFIWDFVKKYIFRCFASRYLFLPFKPLRHNRMMSGFLGENTENFSDLIQIKKIPFSGGRPAEERLKIWKWPWFFRIFKKVPDEGMHVQYWGTCLYVRLRLCMYTHCVYDHAK